MPLGSGQVRLCSGVLDRVGGAKAREFRNLDSLHAGKVGRS